jgi:hypothetical protein
MTSGLLIAQLALYAPLTLPTLYLLYSHGRHGLFAWLYLLAFCVLRITGAAMGLNDPHNTGTQIISSIGLSPLLLSIDGMLHEAYVTQETDPNTPSPISCSFIKEQEQVQYLIYVIIVI